MQVQWLLPHKGPDSAMVYEYKEGLAQSQCLSDKSQIANSQIPAHYHVNATVSEPAVRFSADVN